MFDFHMHSRVSYDGKGDALEMARAALQKGLKEICFTDHMDYLLDRNMPYHDYDLEAYSQAYDALEVPGLIIRKGCEVGLTEWNGPWIDAHLRRRQYDFVIGSVHYVDGENPYAPAYWEGRTKEQAFEVYLEKTLQAVEAADNFDVLGHLTYAAKSPANPTHEPLRYEDFRELIDEILRVLVRKGKGMEINTSGMARVGTFLPSADILFRFRELGGELVTMGSDAHSADRVGEHMDGAAAILKEVFGYVCTFEGRNPVFHKL